MKKLAIIWASIAGFLAYATVIISLSSSYAISSSGLSEKCEDCVLEQDIPFFENASESSSIGYYIPINAAGKATIVVEDLHGVEVLKFEGLQKGNRTAQVQISSNQLHEDAIYLYKLVIDGQTIDSRQLAAL